MAEESGDGPVTPDIVTKLNEGNSRRVSLGKASVTNSGDKAVPHYLRASTGSCHDLCKYGTHREFEAKERKPIRMRQHVRDPSLITSMILPERKRTSFGDRPKSSPGAKSALPDVPEVIKHVVPTKTVGARKMNSSQDHQIPVTEKTKMAAAKIRPVPNAKTRLSESLPLEKQEKSVTSRVVNAPSKQSSSKSKEINVSVNISSSKPKTKSTVQPPKPTPDVSRRASTGANNEMKIGKQAAVPKVALRKVVASPRAPLQGRRATFAPNLSNSELMKMSLPGTSIRKISRLSLSPGPAVGRVSKALSSAKPSLSKVTSLNARKLKSLKVAPAMKIQGKVKKEETDKPKTALTKASKIELNQENAEDPQEEKTLYVVKMETEKKSLESDQNQSLPMAESSSSHMEEDEETSDYTEYEGEDDSFSEHEETVNGEEKGDSKADHQDRLRKHGSIRSEDKDSEAKKLRFRRGKVVDIQSEKNTPRRLKFRRGRVLDETLSLSADGRRSFNKKGVDTEKKDNKPNSEKVVLRHQDVQGKKDSQILFNNVIEQTASKLVETRKSKVKALVGAFETVISLQDTKPSANTVA